MKLKPNSTKNTTNPNMRLLEKKKKRKEDK